MKSIYTSGPFYDFKLIQKKGLLIKAVTSFFVNTKLLSFVQTI
jgi:hypothetical protein